MTQCCSFEQMDQSRWEDEWQKLQVKTSLGGHLCDDILVMIDFTWKWVGGDILDELDFRCKTQPNSSLDLVMVK